MLYNDINLIPSKKSGTASAKIVIWTLFTIMILSIVGIYMVYEPLMAKQEKQDTLDRLNAVIDGYGDIAVEYIKARDEYRAYIDKTENLKEALRFNSTAREKIDTIMDCCPRTVYFTNFTLNKETIGVSCVATDYDAIASFIDSLKEIEDFSDISYSTISLIRSEDTESYTFSISLKVAE